MNEELEEALLRAFLAAAVLVLVLLLSSCQDPELVCCQHYNGKPSGAILTTYEDYEEDVLETWGLDMDGELSADSARVMFVNCKKL